MTTAYESATDVTPLDIVRRDSADEPQDRPCTPTQNPPTHIRALSEDSPMEQRRNSPSFNRAALLPKRVIADEVSTTSSSPAAPSSPAKKDSPMHAFWQRRDSEEVTASRSFRRQSSIEKLKRASRVQNNAKLFNNPNAGRPLSYHAGVSNAPLSLPAERKGSVRRNSVDTKESPRIPQALTTRPGTPPRDHTPPPREPLKLNPSPALNSPMRTSPTKSSFLSYKTSYDKDSNALPSAEQSPVRRPKSVTFDHRAPHVLEYEMITPDPSVDGSPGPSYDSEDDDDDDSFDNLEHLPVSGPEDWSQMPTDPLPPDFEPYRSTPSPSNSRPLPPIPGVMQSANGESTRPLPTLPTARLDLSNQPMMQLEERVQLMMGPNRHNHDEDDVEEHREEARSTTMEDESKEAEKEGHEGSRDVQNEQGQDTASEAASEATGLGITEASSDSEVGTVVANETMSPIVLPEEEHMDDDDDASTATDDTERELDESVAGSHTESQTSTSEYEPPRLSRDIIRRQVEARRQLDPSPFTSPNIGSEPNYIHYRGPSLSRAIDEAVVKSEPSESGSETGLYSVTEYNRPASRFAARAPDPDQMTETESSTYNDGDDESSQYSKAEDEVVKGSSSGEATPTPASPAIPPAVEVVAKAPSPSPAPSALGQRVELAEPTKPANDSKMGLPDLGPLFGGEGLGLKEYMTPSPVIPQVELHPPPKEVPSTRTTRDFIAQAAQNPEAEASDDESDTGSVIRHNVAPSSDEESDEEEAPEAKPNRLPSPVADKVATIRAPGGSLKTRVSSTPTDMAAMAAVRRQVSGDHRLPPPVPRVPKGYQSDGEVDSSSEDDDESQTGSQAGSQTGSQASSGTASRRVSNKSRKSSTKLPALGEFEFDLKLDDLTDEFDRVIEKSKRGYLMRQNTRVIHASSRDPEDESKPAGKPGHARGQSWSVEPWRTTERRKSSRSKGDLRKKPSNGGAVPPLPGKEGVASRLPSVNESEGRGSMASADDDSGERGRLFVKVIGVKDLALPLPQGQPQYFSLTLDNGLHCVTTSWLELAKNAPIGQEFELVVLNDLEFQLTLQTKLEPPKASQAASISSFKAPVAKPKQSTLSRVFQTPKKRRQLEQQHQQQLLEQQRQQKAATPPPQTAWELLHGTVARDGSFARSYVSLSEFEEAAYGRPCNVDIPCFNEWAVDTASLKNKKGMQASLQPARKAPYQIGKLEVQLMFVPRPKGATESDLPKSMNSAIRELREAESYAERHHQGFLSQQGGDCPFWRRRFFRLDGSRLNAYHEATRAPRATINLNKAVKLIVDRNTLVEPTVSGPGKSRRKSGFNEEEEGYMFVEEGFRIRFANGEVIDFYADSAADKDGWMAVLSDTIGRVPDTRGWCQLVFHREERMKSERRTSQPPTPKSRQAPPRYQQQAPQATGSRAPPRR